MPSRTRRAERYWRDHLKWMRHRRNITQIKSDFVFCHLDGSPIKNFNNAWWRALEIAEIKDFHFHDLRHTAASLMLNHGVPVIVASKRLGHSLPSTTLDVYGHLYHELQNDAAKIMDDLVTPIPVEITEKVGKEVS